MRAATETLESIIASNGQGWSRLFEPNDFFIKYTNYFMCNIIAVGNDAAAKSWIGFCEAKLRLFPRLLLKLPIKHPIHLYPNPFSIAKEQGIHSLTH